MKKTFNILMIVALTTACQYNKNNDEPNAPLPDAQPIVLQLADKTVTDNAFALDLFKTAYAGSNKPNVFVSPLSVSMALNMTLNGAAGTTAEEMLVALRATDYTIDQINEYSRSLRLALLSVDPSTEIAIANSIWCREGFPVKPPFLNVNRNDYFAEVSTLDFSRPEALTRINGWCATNTKDKIKEIIDGIPGNAMMYLINAIYFKGIWASKFNKNNTRTDDFHLDNGTAKRVEMMHQTQDFNYTEDETARYLELPYGNRAFSMILMLPKDEKTIDDLVSNLSSEQWTQMSKYLSNRTVNLSLPRFKIECTYSLGQSILPEMGMRVPFSSNADFSGISDIALHISFIIHKTFVEVNEEGTEAAAVTATGMFTTSLSREVDYVVNKPFLFAIREKSTGVILFIGKAGNV
ncbi:MAG: serpin family protein [Prevotellaceae bacterium]|jgi:serpin B|nr:serpin family protein [Prevotellaceae bacterium]